MTEITLTDAEAATLRTAHDILASLASRVKDTLGAIPEETQLAEIVASDDSRVNRLYRLNVGADSAAYNINLVLAVVTEVTAGG